MARILALLIVLPTILAAPQAAKKDATARNGFSPYAVGPLGSVGIGPNPLEAAVPYGPRPRPAVGTSPCDIKKCRVSSPCCEPEPEVEKYTVPVQPIVAPTIVGYEYAEVSRPVAVEVPKCDRTACASSRPCCDERVTVGQPSVSSFVVPVSNSNYNPSYYNYPYPQYYGGYSGFSNFYGGYPYLGGSGVTRPSPNVNVPTPLVVEPEVKGNRVN